MYSTSNSNVLLIQTLYNILAFSFIYFKFYINDLENFIHFIKFLNSLFICYFEIHFIITKHESKESYNNHTAITAQELVNPFPP